MDVIVFSATIKNMSTKLIKYAGPAGIATLWLSVGFSLIITQFDVFAAKPISYLGVYQDSKILFNLGLIISAVLLLVFAMKLIP